MDPEKLPGDQKREKANLSSSSILRVTLRILIVTLVGGVIGAVIYFSAVGWVPYLEQRLFEPVENNQDLIQELEATQHALEDQLAFLFQELRENQVINNQDLESAFEAADQKIAEIQSAIETVNSFSLTQVPNQLATLTANQLANENHLSALATAQMGYLQDGYEIELAKIIALLSKANQYLLHANYGFAEDQLIAAQGLLVSLEEHLNSWQRLQALEIASAIEGAIADLPDQPSLASGKVELAWQLALRGFHTQDLQGTPSPTPKDSTTPTPTPN